MYTDMEIFTVGWLTLLDSFIQWTLIEPGFFLGAENVTVQKKDKNNCLHAVYIIEGTL